MNRASAEVTRQLEQFRFDEAAEAARAFFWNELADWYLELIKPRMQADAPEASRAAAQATLVVALDTVLRLLHPIMPFVTEALWRQLPSAGGESRAESLIVVAWPKVDEAMHDAAAEAHTHALIEPIRTFHAPPTEYNVPP